MVNKLWCKLFGHKYFLIKKFEFGNKKVGCRRCGMEFAMSDELKTILPWDKCFDEMERVLELSKEAIKENIK